MSTDRISQAIKTASAFYRGPGGAIAVIKDGELVDRYTWGFADMDRRIPMTAQTQIPICSISKHMVCQILHSLVLNPTPAMAAKGDDVWELLTKEFHNLIPDLQKDEQGKEIRIQDLANNQSGIRDYWAMTTLWGAKPGEPFRLVEDAPEALKRTRSCHFPPGTEYSYCNLNFHILGRLIEKVSEVPLEKLLADRLFAPAGMETAALRPDTAVFPETCVGYEGDEKDGYRPADNAIQWSGDAGINASLDDMIAYEIYADRSWTDLQSPYRLVAEPQKYKDGTVARYGNGLGHDFDVSGLSVLRHGGALRGFRLHRIHAPSKRMSVVVLFNHEAYVGSAAEYILEYSLGLYQSEDEKFGGYAAMVAPYEWNGDYLDADTQLFINVLVNDSRKISITYEGGTEAVKIHNQSDSQNQASSKDMDVKFDGETLHIVRKEDHRTLRAKKLVRNTADVVSTDYTGEFFSEEADSVFHCSGRGENLFGAFDGYLGKGAQHLMRYLGEDVWAMADPRALDAGPPGDWTLVFGRDDKGNVDRFTIGCWLARKIRFVKRR